MRILIVDDNRNKNAWIRTILEKKQVEYEEITNMNVAFRKIVNNPKFYTGIILDMKFPEISGGTPNPEMGEKFLKRLKIRKLNIPVLGNSTMEFPTSEEYPNLKGNTHGYTNPEMLNNFLKNL